jgi:GNAT superfamily N-acetyltransferase
MESAQVSLDHVRQHERMELDYFRDWFDAAPREIAARYGLSADTAEGAVLLVANRIDVLMFNRAMGIGLEKPVTEAQLDGIAARYRAAGVPRFFVPLSPAAEPAEARDWLLARGLTRFNRWAKLERGVEPIAVANVATDARIEEVGPGHAAAFAGVLREVFGLDPGLELWIAALAGRKSWRHYMAFDGSEPVGTASLFVRGEWASLGFAATLPRARGRGVQSALIARRVADARAMGCRWLSVETAEDKPDKPAPSFHNVTRLGFRIAYFRDNYLGVTSTER